MKGAWPVEAQAIGGRHYRGNSLDQNFDTYSVEYTYPDGTKLFYDGRNMPGVHNEFASYVHGVEGLGRDLDLCAHAGPHAASIRDRRFRGSKAGSRSRRTRRWCGRSRSRSTRRTTSSGRT